MWEPSRENHRAELRLMLMWPDFPGQDADIRFRCQRNPKPKSFDGLDFRTHYSTCCDATAGHGCTRFRRQGVGTGNAREVTRKGTRSRSSRPRMRYARARNIGRCPREVNPQSTNAAGSGAVPHPGNGTAPGVLRREAMRSERHRRPLEGASHTPRRTSEPPVDLHGDVLARLPVVARGLVFLAAQFELVTQFELPPGRRRRVAETQ